MKVRVVDTNVAIVANARDTHADLACQHACVVTLQSLVAAEAAAEVVAIDDMGLILAEYGNRLSYSGRPGVGDMFFKHVFDNQYQPNRVRRVQISPTEDDERGFEELPPNTFDPSDRKFLAVAAVADAIILNATDSDWGESAALVSNIGVEVQQLCPQHATKQARSGAPR